MPEPRYTSQYYDRHSESVRKSARVIVPLVLELLEPRSVCDVGCGPGTWLSVFAEHGITDVAGIDGDYVEREKLEIPAERFLPADLRDGLSLDRKFDLALCLEVAEHLPEASAAALVDGLVRLAPAVLFSAAIPGQGGRGHVNEQWPGHWKAHFERGGFVAVDCIRPRIWNARVLFWYSQNILLFVDKVLLDSRPQLAREYEGSNTHALPLVHPKMLDAMSKRPWIRLKRFKDDRDAGRISKEEFEAKLDEWVSEV